MSSSTLPPLGSRHRRRSRRHARRAPWRCLPAPDKCPVVHCVIAAGASVGEALGLLCVPPCHRQHVQPETLLRREPIVELAESGSSHPVLLAFSTPSRASRRPSRSSISFHLRSSSIALRAVLRSWFAAIAVARSTSPESTSSVRLLRRSFMSLSPSAPDLAGRPRPPRLPPLDALRRRSWEWSGWWLKHH